MLNVMIKGNLEYAIGGLASQLEANGLDFRQSELGRIFWSASIIIQQDERQLRQLIDAHKQYLLAGAQIITTNTYQACWPTMCKQFCNDESRCQKVLNDAVLCARKAVDECREAAMIKEAITIAASIGPYAAVLHDGSEYNGSYIETTNLKLIENYHYKQGSALIQAGCNFLAFETVPSIDEAQCIVRAIEKLKLEEKFQCWISFCCNTSTTVNHGETFSDCYRAVSDSVDYVGINCTDPKLVAPLLMSVSDRTKPFVVYPNSGSVYDIDKGWQPLEPTAKRVHEYALQWIQLGAVILGGCCQVLHEDIAKIKERTVS